MSKLERLGNEYCDKENITDPQTRTIVIKAYEAGYLRHVEAWLNKEK